MLAIPWCGYDNDDHDHEEKGPDDSADFGPVQSSLPMIKRLREASIRGD